MNAVCAPCCLLRAPATSTSSLSVAPSLGITADSRVPVGSVLAAYNAVRAVRAARPAAPALRDLMHHGIVVLFVFLQVHMPKGACMTAHSGRLVHPGVAPSHWHVTART